MDLSFINKFLFAIPEGLLILLFYQYTTDDNKFIVKNPLKALLFIAFYTTFTCWAAIYFPQLVHTLLSVSFMFLILFLTTPLGVKQTIGVIGLFMLYIVITESLLLFIILLLKGINIANVVDNPIVKFQISILGKSLQLILFFVISRFKIIRFTKSINESKSLMPIFFLLGSFLMGLQVYTLGYVHTSSYINLAVYQALSFLLFSFFIILGIFVYKERMQLFAIHQRYVQQEYHIKNIESIVNIIKREKHDFANHINIISGLCSLNNEDSLSRIKNYLLELSYDLQNSYHYYNSGSEYIDALLTVKSNYCHENDISLEVDFEAPLSELDITSKEKVVIISNLIDNAVDALNESDENRKILSISSYIENDMFCLSISNNGPQINHEEIEKIFDNGFSTKQKNKKDHGLGLYIIKNITNKNDGKINVNSTEYETEFLIEFKTESKINNKKDLFNLSKRIAIKN